MADIKYDDFPIPSFHFRVKIDGYTNSENGSDYLSFQEVSGLSQSADVIEYRASHSRDFITQKRLGLIKSSPITFKRGVIKGMDEFMTIFDSAIYPDKYFHDSDDSGLDMTIELLDEKGDVMVYWTVYKAVPIKFTAPGLNAESNAISIESMEFEHEGFDTWFS